MKTVKTVQNKQHKKQKNTRKNNHSFKIENKPAFKNYILNHLDATTVCDHSPSYKKLSKYEKKRFPRFAHSP